LATVSELQARQKELGLSIRSLARELGVSHAYLVMLFQGKRPLTPEVGKAAERFLRETGLQGDQKGRVEAALDSFIHSSSHRSPKTIETLKERLTPFRDYLEGHGIANPLDITREHIDGFLREIAKGRKGKPLSPASLFGYTKDVAAFLNFVADNLAPEDWRNPARKLKLSKPQVAIHPLSQGQVDALLVIAESTAPTSTLKARNRAMLYVLLDGALRIGELTSARKLQLAADGILRVFGKGAKEREVALAPTTLAALSEYLALRQDSSPFLFVSDVGTQLTYTGVKSLFHRWRKAAPNIFEGVRLSAHTLRHTSATMRRVAGVSEGDLQTFLGHATPAMTRHYSAFALSRSANAAARRTSPIEAIA
jgi:integrase/recombinase XerD